GRMGDGCHGVGGWSRGRSLHEREGRAYVRVATFFLATWSLTHWGPVPRVSRKRKEFVCAQHVWLGSGAADRRSGAGGQGRPGGARGVLGPVLGADHREVVAIPAGGAADGGLSAGGARGAAGGARVHGGQEVPRESARPALRGGPPGARGARGGGRSAAGGRRGGAAAGAAGGGGAGAAAGGDPRGGAARALPAVSGHDGQPRSVHRAARHGVGDHLRLPGDRLTVDRGAGGRGGVPPRRD